MTRTLTCILCPNGCELTVREESGGNFTVLGSRCAKGKEYAVGELLHPERTIATSVPLLGGDAPLISVRLNRPIPKEAIFAAMTEINKLRPQAPVSVGQVLLPRILGYNSDVIATRNAEKAAENTQ